MVDSGVTAPVGFRAEAVPELLDLLASALEAQHKFVVVVVLYVDGAVQFDVLE